MARVSLIVLNSPGLDWPVDRIEAYRAGLEQAGYPVEVLAISDPDSGSRSTFDQSWLRSIVATGPGLAEAAVSGIRLARSPLIVVVDLAMPYTSADLLAVVEALVSGQVVLAISSRPVIGVVGAVSRRFLGTTDPTSGMIGLSQASAVAADDSFAPVGSQFTLELLARVAGRRGDVPVDPVRSVAKSATLLADLRQVKRLADDRFGLVSRLIQFCFVGASGMVVDLSIYAILQLVLARTALAGMTAPIVGGSLALAVAAVLAIATALTWNFSINRRLTFNDARQGSIPRQYLRYVLSNLLGIGVSLSLRLLLPIKLPFFRAHRLAAAVVGIVAATGISFSMARWFVFGSKPSSHAGRPVKVPARRCEGFRTMSWTRLSRPIAPLEGASVARSPFDSTL